MGRESHGESSSLQDVCSLIGLYSKRDYFAALVLPSRFPKASQTVPKCSRRHRQAYI